MITDKHYFIGFFFKKYKLATERRTIFPLGINWTMCRLSASVCRHTTTHEYFITLPDAQQAVSNQRGLLVLLKVITIANMDIRTIIHKSQPNSLITLMFQSHHETFIRRSWYYDRFLDVTVHHHIKIQKN